jgi:hypothetical protein
MISAGFDFEQFADSVKEKDFYDIIYLAEQEAIETWRNCYKSRSATDGQAALCRSYQNKLEGLIRFLRYGITSSELSDHDIEICTLISHNIELQKLH